MICKCGLNAMIPMILYWYVMARDPEFDSILLILGSDLG